MAGVSTDNNTGASVYDKAAQLKEQRMEKDGVVFSKVEEGDMEDEWGGKETFHVVGSAVTPELAANGESQVKVPDWLSNSGKFDTADMDFCNLQDNHTRKLANERRRAENAQVAQFQAQASKVRDEAAMNESIRQSALRATSESNNKKQSLSKPAAKLKRKKIAPPPPARQEEKKKKTAVVPPPAAQQQKKGLGGLVAYGSDDDSS